jgi:hypothetical protein
MGAALLALPRDPVCFGESEAQAAERTARGWQRKCGACPAQPGQKCDGSRTPAFEGMHFARREAP